MPGNSDLVKVIINTLHTEILLVTFYEDRTIILCGRKYKIIHIHCGVRDEFLFGKF